MKKYLNITIAAFTAFAFFASCTKEVVAPGDDQNQIEAQEITISATIVDNLTKVAFDPIYASGKPTSLALTWQSTDKLLVADHNDPSSSVEFTLTSGADTKTAVFSGTAPVGATSYDVSVVHEAVTIEAQSQVRDGDASKLQYMASKENVTDLSSIVFDNVNSVLAITAKMPSSEVAAVIKSVDITASANIFGSDNTLTITLDNTGDTGSDGILHLFATLPKGSTNIDAGTTLLVHFNAPLQAHDVYTRFIELPATEFTSEKLNTININASQSDKHAGLTSCDGSTSAKAYLIGDKYQMQEISLTTTKKYYKLVDDINLDGVTWTSLNPDGTGIIDLDGNGKTISHLGAPLFVDFNGEAKNLTIDEASYDAGESTGSIGIFACTVKTTASIVNNVDISNSSLTSKKAYSGGVIGQASVDINLSNVDVINTNISGGLTGGIVGYTSNTATISSCSFNGGTITAYAKHAGGLVGATRDGYITTISDCSVGNATLQSAFHRLGGAVGTMRNGTTMERTNVGENGHNVTITATGDAACYTGGLVGLMEGGTIRDNCNTYVTLTGVKSQVGGFVGEMQTGTVTGGKSHGTVNGPMVVGGFFGLVTGATSITNNESNCAVTADSLYVGGFAGRLAGSVSVSNCSHKTGKVWSKRGSGKEACIGGFAGWIGNKGEAFTGTITQCYVVSAEVAGVEYKADGTSPNTTGQYVGGFAGGIGHSTPGNNTGTVQNCGVSSCRTTGSYYTGGFAGASYANIEKCMVTGDIIVRGYGNYVGGFSAYHRGHYVKYCYSTANTNGNGKTNVGGLIGYARDTQVEECYSSGTVTSGKTSAGGMIGAVSSITTTKLIRWNHSNYNTIVGGETAVPEGCYVKTSSDSNFLTVATNKGWSTDGTIWTYSGGSAPTLVGVTIP